MVMVGVANSSLQAGSQPKSTSLVWGSVAAWRPHALIRWSEWTLIITSDNGSIDAVLSLLLLLRLQCLFF